MPRSPSHNRSTVEPDNPTLQCPSYNQIQCDHSNIQTWHVQEDDNTLPRTPELAEGWDNQILLLMV